MKKNRMYSYVAGSLSMESHNAEKHTHTRRSTDMIPLADQSVGAMTLVSSTDISIAVMYKHAKQFLPAGSIQFADLSGCTFLSSTITQVSERSLFFSDFYPLSTVLSEVQLCKEM